MTKYKQAVDQMVRNNKGMVEEYLKIAELYKKDQDKCQNEFDRVGIPLLRLVEETENRLCGKMEGAGKSLFSANVAEKFREEIRARLPLIDMVGVKVS